MTKTKLQIGEISKPRFEFRTFGQGFGAERKLMEAHSAHVPSKVKERTSEETYIISKTNDVNNTKIRDGKMDIKTFVKEVDGLEQWNPLLKAEFPLKADFIKKDLFDAFRAECPKLDKEEYSYDEFMELINDHKELQAVNVKKHRFGFMINDTICEYGEVLINGALVATLNSESTEISDIKKNNKGYWLNRKGKHKLFRSNQACNWNEQQNAMNRLNKYHQILQNKKSEW